jgi:hypothetical protein
MPSVPWVCLHCGREEQYEDEASPAVRLCPRCLEPMQQKAQQSATTPSGEASPASEGKLKVAERDSIFTDDAANETLFGEEAPPRVEMPAAASASGAGPHAAPDARADATQRCSTISEAAASAAGPEAGPGRQPEPHSEASFEAFAQAPQASVDVSDSALFQPPTQPPNEHDLSTEITAAQLLAAASRRTLARTPRSGLFLALLVIPLISYAILATIAIIILYLRPQPSPFEYLPDVQGDFKGAKHGKQGSISYERLQPDLELPGKLKVRLRRSIALGDVEVTPLRVELRPIAILSPGLPAMEPAQPALVLQLRLKNISADTVFCPTDPYFERRWKADAVLGSKPYTFLEMGERRFYGGPLAWQPGRRADERETVQGQEHRVLNPGESVTTFVCTDPEDRADAAMTRYRGQLLWRVQVRRGLVTDGEQEAPATAVVGVVFDAAEVHKS